MVLLKILWKHKAVHGRFRENTKVSRLYRMEPVLEAGKGALVASPSHLQGAFFKDSAAVLGNISTQETEDNGPSGREREKERGGCRWDNAEG